METYITTTSSTKRMVQWRSQEFSLGVQLDLFSLQALLILKFSK